MQIFTCDKCKEEFGGPLDSLEYNKKMYDLCYPCRKKLEDAKQKAEEDFYSKI